MRFILLFHFSAHRACWFGEYKCDNGQCIQAYGVCNGQNDCIDGSDEKQCNPMGMFKHFIPSFFIYIFYNNHSIFIQMIMI